MDCWKSLWRIWLLGRSNVQFYHFVPLRVQCSKPETIRHMRFHVLVNCILEVHIPGVRY